MALEPDKLDATDLRHDDADNGFTDTATSSCAVPTPPSSHVSHSHSTTAMLSLHTNLGVAALNPQHEFVTTQPNAPDQTLLDYGAEPVDADTGVVLPHEVVLQYVVATLCPFHQGRMSRMLVPHARTGDVGDPEEGWFMRWVLDYGMQEHAVVLINSATGLPNLARRCACTLP